MKLYKNFNDKVAALVLETINSDDIILLFFN